MKTKRKYFYLDDFEHRLLVECLMTARNEYIHEDKPIEDVNERTTGNGARNHQSRTNLCIRKAAGFMKSCRFSQFCF